MRNPKANVKQRTSARGFTVVECLIALAISAVLLTAVAVAFNASVMNYTENENTFWAVNNARQALARMTAEIRTAGYLPDPAHVETFLSVVQTSPANKCEFYTSAGEFRTYEYRSATHKLYLIKGGQEYVLCDNIVVATFTKVAADTTRAKSVQIMLTVRSGDMQRTLSAAATVRRTPAYLL